jgi:hypothetical protein
MELQDLRQVDILPAEVLDLITLEPVLPPVVLVAAVHLDPLEL